MLGIRNPVVYLKGKLQLYVGECHCICEQSCIYPFRPPEATVWNLIKVIELPCESRLIGSKAVVANLSIAIYRSISHSSLLIPEFSGLTGCRRAADQLCVGCLFFTRAVCPLLVVELQVYLLYFLQEQVGLCTELNVRTLRCEDTHLLVCR